MILQKFINAIMTRVKIVVVVTSGCICVISLWTGNAFSQPREARRDTFEQIEIVIKDTKTSVGQFIDKMKEITQQSTTLDSWKDMDSDRLENEYSSLNQDISNGIIYSEELREKTVKLQGHLNRVSQYNNASIGRENKASINAAYNQLKSNIELADKSPLLQGNKLVNTIKNKLVPESGKTLENLQKKISQLKTKAKNTEQSKNMSTIQSTVAQIGIFVEIQKNQLALYRELIRIYAQAAAQNVGVKDEFKQALGDPAWLPETAQEMVDQGWDTAFMIKDLLSLINGMSFTITGIDPATVQAYDRANGILKNAEDKKNRVWD